jgi:integrase/recombinase XerD
MLTEFFDSASRIRKLRDGFQGRLLEGFAQELCQADYALITARRHIRAAEHFIYWTGQEGAPVADLGEWSVEDFVHHLDQCQCRRDRNRQLVKYSHSVVSSETTSE